METSKLLEYLSIIIDLEKNKYVQEEAIKKLDNNIASYQIEFKDNLSLNARTTNTNQKAFENIKVDGSGKGLMYFMVYYLGCIGMGLGVIGYHVTYSMGVALLLGIVGAVAGGSIPVFVWKNILQKRRSQAVLEMERAQQVDNELKQSRAAWNEEITIIVPKLEAERKTLQETYQLTCQTLKKCYEIDIIPVKYRNIIPICMFYDYILNGRTYSLKRNPQAFDEGAINMYEEQVKHEEILNKFNLIIHNLEDLKQGQKVLYNAIQDGNRKTHELLNNINNNVADANKNLQTIQYQNEQRNRCLEYMSFVAYQNFRP